MSLSVIVGAGPGISYSIAARLGATGRSIGLIARNRSSLEQLRERLSAAGIGAHSQVADAGDADQIRTAIVDLVAKAGPCTSLVYNAAVMKPGTPLDVDTNTLRSEFDVNVVGALVAAQAVAPSMVAAGSGSIVFTGGGLALEPFPEWTSLALGKAALRSLRCRSTRNSHPLESTWPSLPCAVSSN